MALVPLEPVTFDLRFKCIITNDSSGVRQTYNCPSNCSVGGFYHEVAKLFRLVPETFELLFQPQSGGEITIIPDNHGQAVIELGFQEARNRFVIRALPGTDIQEIPEEEMSDMGQVHKRFTSADAEFNDGYAKKSLISGITSTFLGTPSTGPVATGYVGLANQGATCYLNSLVQSLYMTPEFRNAILRYRRIPGAGDDATCIPYQLQRLFIQLLTTQSRSVETTALTRSFGWTHGEAFQQHDVQELLRVLFDALEAEWRGTEQASVLADLYQGQMQDYVHCKTCGNESLRTDVFSDISLVLRQPGKEAIGDVTDALRAFITPETLDGDNQYSCERCKTKVDALKGLKFTRFPRILTLQLKRFDYDYDLQRRVKLNDRVTFPQTLNMAPYLADGAAAAGGACTYQLLSVMIHSGSAMGGHYYAHIMSQLDRKWYCFNDSSVTEVTKDQFERAFGVATSTFSSGFSSAYGGSTSAYMLMYRLVDDANPGEPMMTRDTIPEHVRALASAIEADEERVKAEEDAKRRSVTLDIYVHPKGDKPAMRSMTVDKSRTLRDVTAEAHKLWQLGEAVPLANVRLRRYTQYNDALGADFGADKLGMTLTDLGLTWTTQLFLEVAGPDGKFEEIKATDIIHKVVWWDRETKTFSDPRRVSMHRLATVGQLLDAIAAAFGVDRATVRAIKLGLSPHSPNKLLGNDAEGLQSLYYVYSTETFYADGGAAEGATPLTFAQTEFAQAVEQATSQLELFVVRPDEDPVKTPGERVVADTRRTMDEFKRDVLLKLAAPLALTEFQVHRYTSYNDTWIEITRLGDRIAELYLEKRCRLWLRKGKAYRPGEVPINVMIVRDERVADLLVMPCKVDVTVGEFKQLVVDAFAAEKAEYARTGRPWTYADLDLPIDRLRVRDCVYTGDAPRGMFLPGERITGMFAHRRVCIQVLPGPEIKTAKEQVLVYARRWHPDQYAFGPLEEFVVDKAGKLVNIATELATLSGLPVDRVSVAKLPYSDVFPFDLARSRMKDMQWDPSVNALSGYPMYLDVDGQGVVYKDRAAVPKTMTQDEVIKCDKEDSARLAKATHGYSYTYTPLKEKSLKIYTKKDVKDGETGVGIGSSSATPAGTPPQSVTPPPPGDAAADVAPSTTTATTTTTTTTSTDASAAASPPANGDGTAAAAAAAPAKPVIVEAVL